MNWTRVLVSLLLCLILSACAVPEENLPTPPPLPVPDQLPVSTDTATPIPTPDSTSVVEANYAATLQANQTQNAAAYSTGVAMMTATRQAKTSALTLAPPTMTLSPTQTLSPTPVAEISLELAGQFGGRPTAIAVQGNYAYVGVGPRLIVLKISNPARPETAWQSWMLPGTVVDIGLAGSRALILTDNGRLLVLDISQPSEPLGLNTETVGRQAHSLVIENQRIYIAGQRAIHSSQTLSDVLTAYDLTAAGDLIELATYETIGPIQAIAVTGGFAYISIKNEETTNGVAVIDIRDPDMLVEVSFIDFGEKARVMELLVKDSLAYLLIYDGEWWVTLEIYDISDSEQPRHLATPFKSSHVYRTRLALVGHHLYLAYAMGDEGGLWGNLDIFDTSDSSQPIRVSHTDITYDILDVAYARGYVFVPVSNGIEVINVLNVFQPKPEGRYELTGALYELAWQNGYIYAISGDIELHVIDVRDPTWPFQTTWMRFWRSCKSCWIENVMASASHYVYVARGYWGVGIVDVSGFPRHVADIDRPPDDISTPVAKEIYTEISDIVAIENYLYLGGSTFSVHPYGLYTVDIRDPLQPVVTSEIGGDYGRLFWSTNYLFAYARSAGWQIFDLADPAHPQHVGGLPLPGREVGTLVVSGHYLYASLTGCSPGLCANGLSVYDISNPLGLRRVGGIAWPDGFSTIIIEDKTLYITTQNQIWQVDVTNPTLPRVVLKINAPWPLERILIQEQYIYALHNGELFIFSRPAEQPISDFP